MRSYEEIYNLFIKLINNKINEVKLSFAEIKMLSQLRPKYNYMLNNIYQEGFYYNYADVLKELCEKNNIIQYKDQLNNCYVYKKGDEKMENKEKIQTLADVIQSLLQQIDLFTIALSEEDFELLDEAKETLEKHISRNMSALPLIMACGGNYDSMEDEMKLKTLDLLIELMKTRIEYRDKLKKQQENDKNKEDILKIFGL